MARKNLELTQFGQPCRLENGKWVPATPVAQVMLETQRKRGNPESAPWCEGEIRC